MKMKISENFLRGYIKVLDLSGATKEWPNLSDDRLKDYAALKGDWENVGNSIQREIRNFKAAGG